MIDHRDFWRVANLLMKRHGADAAIGLAVLKRSPVLRAFVPAAPMAVPNFLARRNERASGFIRYLQIDG
jgi:hypothetical protein